MTSPSKSEKAAPVAVPEQVKIEFAYTLESIIEATLNGSFVYTSPEFHNPLVESGDVEVNPELVNENGEIATRATAKHVPQQTEESTQMTETIETPIAATSTVTKPTFVIKSGAIPEVTRKTGGARAGRTAIYPFADLEVGTYFFVPNVGEKSAFTSLTSTVSGANSRYAKVVEGEFRVNRKSKTVPVTRQLRKFKAFDTMEVVDGVEVKGAKVFRLPVDAEEIAA